MGRKLMWSYNNSNGNEVDWVKRAKKKGEGYVVSSLVLRDLPGEQPRYIAPGSMLLGSLWLKLIVTG